ncbi:MAG: Ig-like domain-containing protein [Gemmatimonadetes bacterium]|nr:Ig-like domain-containing protein [Gemmatimonadota bacterium]
MRRLWVLLLAIACRSATEGPRDPSAVSTITVSLAAGRVAIGGSVLAKAVLKNGAGAIIADGLPAWSSLNPTIAVIEANGLITGVGLGTATIRASVGSVTSDVQVVVVNPVATSLVMTRDTATVLFPSGTLQLQANARDASGALIARPDIIWSSATPLIARVSAAGLVTPVAAGTAVIRASMDSAVAQAIVSVQVAPVANAPTITAISPSSTLVPGGTYTLTGANFANTSSGNAVVIDGLPMVVGSSSLTKMVITLPSSGFSCEPTRQVLIQVTAGGVTGGGAATLQVASPRTLQPGQSIVLSAASDVRCNELALTGGRYVVSVYNASRSSITPTALNAVSATLRGAITIGGGQVAAAANLAVAAPSATSPSNTTHLNILERNRGMLTRVAARSSSITTTASTTVGTITPVKLPNLDAANFCVSSIAINARTVFVGQRAVILEDTSTVFGARATLAGQMDDYYRRLGQEFDAVMWPLITTNFGNPLAMDAQIGGVGKVMMVFSPRINVMQQQAVQGFAVSCDLDPTLPSSNAGAFFYAIVPTSTTSGYANGESRDSWLRQVRATVVHEVKHIATFAERRSHALSLDPVLTDVSWEEGMARVAEELYARTFYQSAAKANLRYATSVGCDLTFQTVGAACQDRPELMQRHFAALFSALSTSQSLSPLGRAQATDVSFYGSAWSLLRWAIDHYGPTETQFLTAFTTGTATGVPALEARTASHPWEEILGEWSLAMYLDDLPGFTTANARIDFPSWNLRNIFLGLCGDLGPCTTTNAVQQYPRPIPQQPRAVSFGNFTSVITAMVGGGYTLFDLGGTQTARQLLELKGPNGTDPPSTMRIAIARVQ